MKFKFYSDDGVTEIREAADMDAAKELAEDWMRDGEWGADGARVGVTVTLHGPPRFTASSDGDIEIHTTMGWGYVTTDADTGLADAHWQAQGAKEFATIANNVSPLAAMGALIAAIPADAEAEDALMEEYVEVEIEPDHKAKIKEAAGLDDICGTDPDDHDWTSDGEGGLKENPGVRGTGGTSMTFDSHCRKCGLHRHEKHTGSQRNPDEHDTVEYRMLDEDEIATHRVNGDMDEAEEEKVSAEND